MQGRTSSCDDLQVLDADLEPRAALFGLPPVYRAGLAAALEARGVRCVVVRRLEDAFVVAEGAPLVLVLPGGRGAEVAPALPEREVAVVHVVESLTVAACAEAMRVGATGVVAVDSELDVTAAAVRAAATGHALLPAPLVAQLFRSNRKPGLQLSGRERTWLRALAAGTTVAHLARASGYSEREMYRLLSALYARLGVNSRTEALLLAERCALLDEEPE